MPVVGFLDPSPPDTYRLREFRQGLKDAVTNAAAYRLVYSDRDVESKN
jgi:hypothetical protein